MTSVIVLRKFNEVDIPIRPADRYVNATSMCKACKKRWSNYRQNSRTEEFLVALSSVTGIPVTELTQVRQGGTSAEQGTWVHPRVAINLAQWLSPVFEAHVSGWLEELMTTGTVSLANVPVTQPVIGRPWSERLTESFERHFRYVNSRAPGHFSVLIAVNTHMMCIEDSLLLHGLPCKQSDLPEGSVAYHWRERRRELSLPASVRFAPLHLPQQNKTVDVQLFPPEERGEFDRFLTCDYMPDHLPDYLLAKFRKRFGRLPPLSAADHSCRRVVDRPANISAADRAALVARGGLAVVSSRPGVASLPVVALRELTGDQN